MKYFILIGFVIISLISSAQDKDSDNLNSNSWKVGKTKMIYFHNIKRVSGAGGIFSPTITNIGYKTSAQVMNELKVKAKREMWKDAKLYDMLSFYQNTSGQITLYIVRSTIESANAKWFTVIIKDKEGNEIERQELEEDVPNYSVSNYTTSWYNYEIITLRNPVEAPFYIYIIDRLSDVTQHCFEVLN